MSKQTSLTIKINQELKDALLRFCKEHGLKIQSVVENAIREQLEDEIDLASYNERKHEHEISLDTIFKQYRY